MPDVNERLDRVEIRLKALGERIDEQFAKVNQRFEKLDERFEKADERFEKVDERFGSLEAEVQKLRILGEQNTTDIRRIAEMQAHHGEVLGQHGAALQRIEKALEPLSVLPEAFQKKFNDHESRITALERAHRAGTSKA